MVKPKFIVFSDIHIEDWKRFSKNHSRLDFVMELMAKISTKADKYRVPTLFAGDLFDNPINMSNHVFSRLYKFKSLFKYGLYAISGNHDQCEVMEVTGNYSPNWVNSLSKIFNNIYCIDFEAVTLGDTRIVGIPYVRGNVGIVKFLKDLPEFRGNNILLLHTDLHGAVTPTGLEIGEVENLPRQMSKFFKAFDLVLSGHIHKPQKLGRQVYMLGAPYQQRVSDAGTEMGYWTIYEDMSISFSPLKSPQFFELNEGEPLPDDYNFYVRIPKKVIRDEGVEHNFNTSIKPSKLALRYLQQRGIKERIKKETLLKYIKDDNL